MAFARGSSRRGRRAGGRGGRDRDRGLLATALAAGAGGVRVGTRFVATIESGAHPEYKDALVHASGGGTVLTETFDFAGK